MGYCTGDIEVRGSHKLNDVKEIHVESRTSGVFLYLGVEEGFVPHLILTGNQAKQLSMALGVAADIDSGEAK